VNVEPVSGGEAEDRGHRDRPPDACDGRGRLEELVRSALIEVSAALVDEGLAPPPAAAARLVAR